MLTLVNYISLIVSLLMLEGCSKSSENQKDEFTLKVYHYKVPCMGESVRLCLRVSINGGEPEIFFEEISGFQYQWGFNYEISVQRKASSTPLMADISSHSYELKKVINKEKEEEPFEIPLMIDGVSLIENRDNKCLLLNEVTIETKTYSCAELGKARTAIFRHLEGDKLELIRLNK